MKLRYVWLLLAWLWAVPASAQPVDSGSIVANSSGGGCTVTPPACVVITFSNQLITTIVLQVSGTYTGTLAFEATSSANPLATSAVWFSITGTNLADVSTATGTTSTGQFSFPNSGLMGIRARATAWTSGTAVVAAVRGYAVARGGSSPFGVPIPALASGGCTTPSYTFAGDTDSGIGWLGANNPAGCAGGATIFDWNASRVLFAQPILFTADNVQSIGATVATRPKNLFLSGTGWFQNGGSAGNLTALFGADDGANTLTNNTTKASRVGIPNYANASTPVALWYADSGNTASTFTIGGGTSTMFAMTNIALATAANQTTTTGTVRWNINTNGHFTAGADNTYDFGAAGATRPRTGYFGTSVVSPIIQGSGTGVSVANVGANSCGTDAATIAGNQVSGKVTVGATAGTQCRVTFSTAAPVSRDCTVTDETTTIATRALYVDATKTDLFGAFVAGDKIAYVCVVR